MIQSKKIYISDDQETLGNIKAEQKFDLKGNIVYEADIAHSSGEIISETWSTYDAHGNEINRKIEHYENGLELVNMSYDSNNRLISLIHKNDSEEILNHRKVEWNETGDQKQTKYFDEEGELINKVQVKYNAEGVVLEERYFDGEDTLAETYLFEYDDKGNILKRVGQFGGFDTMDSYNYDLDEKGRITKTTKSDDEGDEENWLFTYHENDQQSSKTHISPDQSKVIEYLDEKGLIIKRERVDKTNYTYFTEDLIYDEGGNLLRKHVLTDGKYLKVSYEYQFKGDEEE